MKSKNKVIGIIMMAILGITILFFTNVNLAANTAKVNVETANLRETADENSRILKQLSLNDNVEVLEEANNWCKVKVNNITGYVRQDLLAMENKEETENKTSNITQTEVKEEQPVTESTETTSERIIKEDTKLKIVPSINATDIVEVKKDEKVNVVESINGWICVQTNVAKGWIREEKLTTKAEIEKQEEAKKQEEQKQEEIKPIKTAYIKETKVNVRKEANQNSEVITKLKLNTSVEVYSEENGWSKVRVDGKEGYISTELLSDKKIEKTENKTTSRSATTTRKANKEENNQETTTTAVSGKGATVVETAKKYIGCKYVYGASGPNSFDCSGFTSYIFRLHGVNLNRTAKGQYSNGTAVARNSLQPGDLVMFGPSVSGINHVGIYIGGGKIVHAANPSRGVTIDSITSGYYNKNYVGARRVI